MLAVGHPAGWVADQVGLGDDVDRLTASLSPDDELSGPGGFDRRSRRRRARGSKAVAPVTARCLRPRGARREARRWRSSRTLLVTGDSLAQPLDVELARRLASHGVRTVRDARLGTGISKSDLLDWGRLSAAQVRKDKPDAIVFFLGANEGFPFEGADGNVVGCCGPAWAAQYATRARQMMQTYRQDGDGPRLLADAADAARPRPPDDRPRRQRRDPRRRRSPTAPRSACST